MIKNFRFELSFKNITQLDNKLNFCRLNEIKNINIPCKGVIKKEFLISVSEYINKNYEELDVTFHYSLFHQYSKNKKFSYEQFLEFIRNNNSKRNNEILLVSGSNKKKNFDILSVLADLKDEKNLNIKLGIAYNPYLEKHYLIPTERERYEKKISSGLVNSVWLQYGTDIKLLEHEFNYLKKFNIHRNIKYYGSLLIPSKQFLARFKFRPWKEVYISKDYLSSLDYFYDFTRDLISFYDHYNITPVIETDASSKEKLEVILTLLKI